MCWCIDFGSKEKLQCLTSGSLILMCSSYEKKAPLCVLKDQEQQEKKDKYQDHHHQAHQHFAPLVYSIDGMEDKEAIAASKQLASKLAFKWGRQYSQVNGLVKSRIGFALTRAQN